MRLPSFLKAKRRHPREPVAAVSGAVLTDFRLDAVSREHLDAFYARVDYPRALEPGMIAHIGGVLEEEQTVYISVWRSEDEAVRAWRAIRDDVDHVLADAPPEAEAIRRSGELHRLYLGDELAPFRASVAQGDPGCVAFVIDLPDVDVKTYDLVCALMDFPDEWPMGLLLHFAGQVEDVLRVVSVWRRAEDSQDFFGNRLIPAAVEFVRERGEFPEILPRELRVRMLALHDDHIARPA